MKTTIFFLLTLLLLSFSFVNADYGGVTLSAWTSFPPIVDGDMASVPGEWSEAASYVFQTDHTVPFNGTIYVMNDAVNLYLFIKYDFVGRGWVRIMFDNDNDRVEWETDDDGLYYGNHPGGGFRDVHFSNWGSDGSQDGAGAGSTDGVNTFVEFSHPLNSGDPLDFALEIGDTVGFQIAISYDGPGPGYWPPQAQTTNDILIAGPPVGGELLSVNVLPVYMVFAIPVVTVILSQTTQKKQKP